MTDFWDLGIAASFLHITNWDQPLIAVSALAWGLVLVQLPAFAILLARLSDGPFRSPPLQPATTTPEQLGTVSVIVPTLNEAARIQPCLDGLSRQSYEVREILVVDSCSQDGTPDLVKAAQSRDPRFRLLTDDPLPVGWVGRPWALHNGFLNSAEQSEWILGIDADTQPAPGLVAAVLRRATTEGYDLLTLSPRFILCDPGEILLQPALLLTLIYRFGPAGVDTPPERLLANGQCFLCRRSVLAQVGGYSSARASFCDDVTLARVIASQGFKVGFADGSSVLKVRMYEGAAETWREWGRSLDLKDATDRAQLWGDLGFLVAVQALPVPAVIGGAIALSQGIISPIILLSLAVNLLLLAMRIGLLFAVFPSYDFSRARARWLFWLSPLADIPAVVRIFLSSIQTPTRWRGRVYP